MLKSGNEIIDFVCFSLCLCSVAVLNVKQFHYRPGVAQRVPGC